MHENNNNSVERNVINSDAVDAISTAGTRN
jgi:hypothetical protein